MCDTCKELEGLLEEALAPVRKRAKEIQDAHVGGAPLGTPGVPSLFALSLMKKGLLEMAERDGCGPEQVLQANYFILKPALEAIGVSARFVVAKDAKDAGKQLANMLEKDEKKPLDFARLKDGKEKKETWH